MPNSVCERRRTIPLIAGLSSIASGCPEHVLLEEVDLLLEGRGADVAC